MNMIDILKDKNFEEFLISLSKKAGEAVIDILNMLKNRLYENDVIFRPW
jgi:hypothetical protein